MRKISSWIATGLFIFIFSYPGYCLINGDDDDSPTPTGRVTLVPSSYPTASPSPSPCAHPCTYYRNGTCGVGSSGHCGNLGGIYDGDPRNGNNPCVAIMGGLGYGCNNTTNNNDTTGRGAVCPAGSSGYGCTVTYTGCCQRTE